MATLNLTFVFSRAPQQEQIVFGQNQIQQQHTDNLGKNCHSMQGRQNAAPDRRIIFAEG